jgi:hypothetical protein
MPRALTLFLVLVLGGSLCAQALPFRALDEPLPPGAALITGDFNADGRVDLLATGGIQLGDGHANFAPTAGGTLTVASGSTSFRVADYNGDGLPDVAYVAYPTARVDLNGPGMVFTQLANAFPVLPTTPGVPNSYWGLVPGDVDGDGDIDLVAHTTTWQANGLAYSAPILLLNNGLGSFSAAPGTAFPVGTFASTWGALTDLDADGDLDLLFSGYAGTSYTRSLVSLVNGGAGAFGPPVVIHVWGLVSYAAATVGEFNGDGYPDVALGDLSGATTTVGVVLLGSAAGFLPAVASPLPFLPSRLLAIDLNGDGKDELLSCSGNAGLVDVHPVSNAGVIGAPTQQLNGIDISEELPNPGAVVDLDGDGDRDVPALVGSRPILLMNDGQGALAALRGRIPYWSFAQTPLAGDVDADGDLDAVGWSTSSAPVLQTLLNDGDGFFSAGPSSPVGGTTATSYILLHAFDKDGDGDADLYGARNITSAFGTAGNDLVFDNSGGVFTLASTVPDDGPVTVIRDLDVDGDGDRDILLGRRSATTISNGITSPMRLLVNLGAGAFAPAVPIGGNHATYDLEIADFDGNGSPDVFQVNRNLFAGTTGGLDPCVLYLNAGGGTFTAFTQTAMTGYYAASGDLNGDGLPDVVLDNQVWFTSGTTFVAGPVFVPALGAPSVLSDVDEDGDLDLVETPATVRFNTGGGVFGAPVSQFGPWSVAPTSWFVRSSIVADFDRDGDPDILGVDGRLHLNALRQIASGLKARPGRPASLDFYGPAGGAFLLYASAGTAAISLPPFGTVLIDPATAFLVHAGAFAPSTAPVPGYATLGATLPPVPSLVGLTIHWQMLDSSLRLSNQLTTTIAGY